MISGIINKVAAGTREYQHVLQEVAEFSALKKEINKARAIVELNAKGEITFVNENLCRALGYRENDLVKQHHKALLSRAESTKPEYEQFWAELNTGKSQVGAFKLLSQQGKEVWFQGYYAPVWDEAAKRLRKVVAYLTDITKDAQRTQSLQASEDALNQSFGVMECDMQGNILHCNNLFAKPLQYTEEELIGKSVAVFLTEAVAKSPDYQEMWRRLRAGEVLSHEIQRFSKSHQPLWFQSTYIPVNDQDNKPYKVLVYSFCITASKQKIADFEGQVAAINNVQGVISFDPAGHVLAANKHFCNYCGYTEKELVGQHHSGLVPESFKQTAEYKSWWSRLAAGEAIVGTFERVRKDGKPFWLQGVYSPIADVNGEVFKIVKYVIDVTEKVQAEQANSQRAREAVMIKNALESSSNNLMVADSDGIITYMNPATLDLMRASSATFKQLFPHFDAEKLIGQNFDVFHKSPAHQRNLLGMLKGKHVTEIPVGDMHFRLTANPIFDAQGERLGSVVEWIDLTQEKRVENQIRQVLDAAVAGDVSSRLDTAGVQGPAVKTMEAINQLLDIFNGVLINVREASETINTAANEIASGNNDLSSRTEQQASNLEETASSMEELASTVKQNADNARQANQMAEAASQVAIRGGEVVGNVVTTMSAINDSAHKIEDIISVIDGIAFQTNILALNAAVEAARAGEQGRGFAVVAGEVRNLAQRSASAAKEIKELITDSVNKTAEGTKLVENAGTTMHEVVTSVQRVTDIMSEITAASAEQSSGINQVNDAVNHMDEVTQQNAALVEEAAAAAESLVEQASNLMDTVNKFTLTAGDTRGSRVSQVTPSVKSRPTPKPAAVNKPQPAAHYQPAKSQKTGTDNQDWEEF